MGNFPEHIDNQVRGFCVAGTSVTALYPMSGTASNNTIIELITVCNEDAVDRYITIQITDGSTTSNLLYQHDIKAGKTTPVSDLIRYGLEPIILKTGDKIQVLGEVAAKLNCYCSGGEYTS